MRSGKEGYGPSRLPRQARSVTAALKQAPRCDRTAECACDPCATRRLDAEIFVVHRALGEHQYAMARNHLRLATLYRARALDALDVAEEAARRLAPPGADPFEVHTAGVAARLEEERDLV